MNLSVDRSVAKSIRPFLAAKDYRQSRSFYRDVGFTEHVIDASMSLMVRDGLGFYLQNAYVKDWADNTMVFWEVDDVDRFWAETVALGLDQRYPGVRLEPIRTLQWGRECFLHDPSGILWHIGQFAQ